MSDPPAGGPTRSNVAVTQRPPTTFVANPVVLNPNPSLNQPAQQDATGPTKSQVVVPKNQRPGTTFAQLPSDPNPNPSLTSSNPGAAGPSKAARPAGAQRPPTAFALAPIKAENSSFSTPVNKYDISSDEPVDPDVAQAGKYANLRLNPNELLQYASGDDIWAKSQAVAQLKGKMDNIYIQEQLYTTLADPLKSKIFGNISSGLEPATLHELRNKMMCVANILLMQIHSPAIFNMVFKNNILDKFFITLLSSPPPITDLQAHYLREIMGNFIKLKKIAILNYLTEPIPGQSKSRASLLFDHFYCENVAYLIDELITLEENEAKIHFEKTGVRDLGSPAVPRQGGSPGPNRGRGGPGSPGPNRGAAPGSPRGGPPRGGPPRGGAPGSPRGGPPRGGPPRGRGGPPRGGAGGSPSDATVDPVHGGRGRGGAPPRGRGRGGPPRRGGAPGSGPSRLPPGPPKWTKTLDFVNILFNQFSGGSEAGSDQMVSVRSQSRIINAAYLFRGLVCRGWDKVNINKILNREEELVKIIFQSPWKGIEAIEAKVGVLNALLMYISKEWASNSELIRRTADNLIKNQLCKGIIRNALSSPPADSLVKPLSVMKNLKTKQTVGAMRIRIIHFFNYFVTNKTFPVFAKDVVQSGIIKEIIQLFFDHPHNFFLHQIILTLVLNLLKTKNEAVLTHIFADCNLLQLIMDNFQPISKSRTKDASSYVSFTPHLVVMSVSIMDNGYLDLPFLANVPTIPKWRSFTPEIQKIQTIYL